MAGSTINIETLATAGKNIFCHGKRHVVAGIVADFPGIEICVLMKLAARNGAINWRTGGAQVCVKIAHGVSLHARLVVHVLPAADKEHGTRENQNRNDNDSDPPKRSMGARASSPVHADRRDARRSTSDPIAESRHQLGTSATEIGFRPSRNWRVLAAS